MLSTITSAVRRGKLYLKRALPLRTRIRLQGIHKYIKYEKEHYGRRALISFLSGATVLALIHFPSVRMTMLGTPDRAMMRMAFQLRADTEEDRANPAVLIDIDDRTVQMNGFAVTPPGREPWESTSRTVIAELLKYVLTAPAAQRPVAVILDVDLGAPAPDGVKGTDAVRSVLETWAKTPNAPTLTLARDAFTSDMLGQPGTDRVLPITDYDDIVQNSSNIYWANTKVLANQDGVVENFLPYQCVMQNGRGTPLYSAAILAYGASIQGMPPKGSPVRDIIESAPKDCSERTDSNGGGGVLIDYHLSLNRNAAPPIWPNLAPDWGGFAACGHSGDPKVFRLISAADILAAQGNASTDVLCRRIVVIGGTNQVASDFQETPLDSMSGPMVLVNAVRGLELTNGGLRQGNLFVEGGVLLLISLMITAGFSASRFVREQYRHRKERAQRWYHHIVLLPLNPVILNGLVVFTTHWVGVGILLISLKYGYWGFLSGPAFGSAMAEVIQDFAEDP